jgi:hypothetical protein
LRSDTGEKFRSVRAYYALVDDLLSEEEFEEFALSLSDGLSADHDLRFAAAAAAEKLGRLHTKIAEIRKGPTLTSFYCRIIGRYLTPESESAVNLLDELNSGSEFPDDFCKGEGSDLFSSYSDSSGFSDGESRYVNTSSERHHSQKRVQKSRSGQNLYGHLRSGLSESLPEFPSLRLMLLVGDDTGEVIIHFRDEMASAVMEIPDGSVIEVAGRYKGSGELYAVDIRLSDNEISLRKDGQRKILYESVCFVILGITFRSYGDEGEGDGPSYFRLFCGSGNYTFTITFRDFSLPEDIFQGVCAKAKHLIRIPSAGGEIRFSAGRNSSLIPADGPAEFTYSSPSDARPGRSASFLCRVISLGRVHQFYSGKGSLSCVRNMTVADYDPADNDFLCSSDSDLQCGCGDDLPCGPDLPPILYIPSGGSHCQNVVLWGEHAKIPVSEGEIIEIVNGFAKIPDDARPMAGCSGGYEIHAGINSLVRVVTSDYCGSEEKISFEGMVIEDFSGFIIENGSLCYILSGMTDGLCNGIPAKVSGILYGMRIDVVNFRNYALSNNNINCEIDNIVSESTKADNL